MNSREENVTLFTSFWPLCLMAVSLVAFLGWQVTAAARQYITLLRLSDQQAVITQQAVKAETKLQAMMTDLLELAKTDTAARAVVAKHNIKFNPATPSALPVEVVLSESGLKSGKPSKALPSSDKTGQGEK